MPYCQNCGKQISENANVCGYCGAPTGMGGQNNYTQQNFNNQQGGYNQPNWNNQQGNFNQQGGYNRPDWNNQQNNGQWQQNNFNNFNQPNYSDRKAFGWEIILSILFPIIGLVFYIINKNTAPTAAKTCGKAALIAFIVTFILRFVAGFLIGYYGLLGNYQFHW